MPVETTTCVGTAWTHHWEKPDGRSWDYNYRLEAIDATFAKVSVSGRYVTPVSHWDTTGVMEFAVADGFTGKSRLHVDGPDSPRMNNLDRIISVTPTP